jgi:hypothetical protein
MPHPLVTQFRFTRSEFVRGLEGVAEEDGRRRLGPMNSIGWIVGHLASQEHTYWVVLAQGQELFPDLHQLVGWGLPASTPSLAEMWDAWKTITRTADRFLDALTLGRMMTYLESQGKPVEECIGTMLLRNIHHYWFHLGEAHAIRQMLGHTNLPQFVGDMSEALYRPESQE